MSKGGKKHITSSKGIDDNFQISFYYGIVETYLVDKKSCSPICKLLGSYFLCN